ncbi:MAG: DUF2179 domain-containing protein [Candidatus Nanoarchaeia archaeon]|nr:DUF2179 domain-containing protein [Candidatus Nanoarchaeia archaeon]
MLDYLMNTWWAIPLMIFFARILDVSIGTIRLIFISKGMKNYAPILGFFEVLIWLLAVKKVMTDVANPITYIAYAGGFATGTYVGMWVEEKVTTGKVLIRVITKQFDVLTTELIENNYPFTAVDGQGKHGEVKIFFLVVNKHQIKELMDLIKKITPAAFYTIEDVRYARENPELLMNKKKISPFFGFFRKDK